MPDPAMLDKALLWGSDQVCTVVGFTGLGKSVGLNQSGVCIYIGSYSAGIIFWSGSAMLLILVMKALRQKID